MPDLKRLVALAIGVYVAVLCVHVGGQTVRPLPGDPLPGITSGDFENSGLASRISRVEPRRRSGPVQGASGGLPQRASMAAWLSPKCDGAP